MRCVVDTNVIVSGLITESGNPRRVVDSILSRSLTVLFDDRILGEYREVLRRPKFRLPSSEVEAFLAFVEEFGEYCSGHWIDVTLPDAADLPFLEVAVAGLADALITGNAKHFRPKKGRHNVRIMTPAEFERRAN
ncbi:MAG TPA: putative toxin-antitoxin system toxin component, PIN family [Terriglobales bacterium]|nr:putative toxin-antitoxin system toxin component, PIN family [Terriglobales bacterium]